MTITTIDDQLAEVRFRTGRLEALGQAGVAADVLPRIQRHLDALHRDEASVRAAAGQAPDEVEEKLGRLQSRLHVAEHSLTADLADDWATFAVAVEADLRSWDTYLERLQATAAEDATADREQVESAIADLRTQRLAVAASLAQAQEQVENAWREQRDRLGVARDELDKKADELSANGKERSTR